MNINLHHLELFYYVALYGGLDQASRKMPYGVVRSTLNRQLCELERQIKAPLFQRRQFKLTPLGEKLYAFIKPIMEELPALIEMWRKGLPESVRLGAPSIVHREYLPPILSAVKQKFPALEFHCSEGTQEQIQLSLKEKSIEVAVTLGDQDPPPGYTAKPVGRLQLVLLVPKNSPLRSATELWRQKEITECLVSLPKQSPVTQNFFKGLARRNVEWRIGLHATTLEQVESYAAQGLGIGLSVGIPGHDLAKKGLKALPLTDFPHVTIVVVWRLGPSEVTTALVQELTRAAGQLSKPTRKKKRAQKQG